MICKVVGNVLLHNTKGEFSNFQWTFFKYSLCTVFVLIFNELVVEIMLAFLR